MAKYTTYFPGGVYPQDYDPAIEGYDFNPMFGDLANLRTAERRVADSTATSAVYDLENGLVLKLGGTGLDFDDDGIATGGKLTKLEVFQHDGTTIVSRMTIPSLSLVTFMDAVDGYDSWTLMTWLLRKADTINGSAGTDDLFGGGGNDTLNGKGGDDTLDGGSGKDKYDGGAGFDMLSFRSSHNDPEATGGVEVNGLKGTAVDAYGNKETFKNIEAWRGTQFADTFVGSKGDNTFDGLGGRDRIDGQKGFDIVRYHRDETNGGWPEQGVTVDLGAGWAIDGFGKKDKLISIEGVRGTAYDDELTGSKSDNLLRGDGGADTLAGGLGNDRLDGGSGDDIFIFNTALNAAKNVDTILGFTAGGDKIHLSLSIFTALGATGALSEEQFQDGSGDVAETESQRIIYDDVSGNLYYDADGSGTGAAILFATLAEKPDLSASDFVII